MSEHARWPGQEAAQALAADADMLSFLHASELDAAVLESLRAVGFPANLALLPGDAMAREAWRALSAALREIPVQPDAAALDELAAEFAAIYLTGAYRLSPCESYWLDQDHLLYQGPMFELRQRYAEAGLRVKDWRKRPEDHVTHQLGFVARLLSAARSEEDWKQLASFLDQHLLRWIHDFARAVHARTGASFYAGLAVLTATWCARLRACIDVPPMAHAQPAEARGDAKDVQH